MQNWLQQTVFVANLAELNQLAGRLASVIKGSETFELRGDLGVGKTAFVRYLARHLQSADAVCSPSFTIENVYRTPQFDIHHFDFYRLEQPGVCAFELAEALADADKLVIVEWAQIVANLLTVDRCLIEMSLAASSTAPERRQFVFQLAPGLNYLATKL